MKNIFKKTPIVLGLAALPLLGTAQTICFNTVVDRNGNTTFTTNGMPVVSGEGYCAPVTVYEIVPIEYQIITVYTPIDPVSKTEQCLKNACEKILFDYDKAKVKEEDLSYLDDVAADMKVSDYKLVIKGHADEYGPEDYNYDLAKKRAQNVYSYLVKKGIDKDRLFIISYGEQNPVSNNPKMNRRVNFDVIEG